jgi:hypothetical protein
MTNELDGSGRTPSTSTTEETSRDKITATFYYPGSFFAEDVTRTISEPTLAAAVEAQPNDGWFAVEVKRTPVKTFRSDDGEERVLPDGKAVKVAKWYVGTAYTAEQVEALDGDHKILVSNMRGNGWATVCRTRRGNWQPVEEGDEVLAEAPVPS